MDASNDWIRVESEGGSFGAYLARPAAPARLAVVVLQEIFGVNANIRGICAGLADAGFAAVAPDLYWRQAPGIELDPGTEQGRVRALELMKGLDREQALSDGVAALEAVRRLVPGVTRSAAIGYCFGGGVAFLMGVRNLVDGAIAYYGTQLESLLGEANDLNGRLLLHIAELDHLCPPPAQASILQAVNGLGERARAVVHEGVGHAFARIEGAAHDAAAADRANAMTMALLSQIAAEP